MKIHGEDRAVGTCACIEQGMYFNESIQTCLPLECSTTCAEGCFGRADRCYDSCQHGLEFHHEAEIDIDGHDRSVGSCKCVDTYKEFNEETLTCEGEQCSESCGQGNCHEEPDRCFDPCPHGLRFIFDDDATIDGREVATGWCRCQDLHSLFNEETFTCDEL